MKFSVQTYAPGGINFCLHAMYGLTGMFIVLNRSAISWSNHPELKIGTGNVYNLYQISFPCLVIIHSKKKYALYINLLVSENENKGWHKLIVAYSFFKHPADDFKWIV
jgi:hypothetical protein